MWEEEAGWPRRRLRRSRGVRKGRRRGTWPAGGKEILELLGLLVRGVGGWNGKRNIFIGAVIKMKLYLMGRVGGQAREGAVEVAVGGGSLGKLFDHVKVVLLHLIFNIWSCVQCTIDHPPCSTRRGQSSSSA